MKRGIPQLEQEIRIEIDKCSKCGRCLSVCPVYLETLDEKKVTRGRITLFEALLDDNLRFTPAVREAIQTCMKCLRCVTICNNDVRFDRVITAIRSTMPGRFGLSIINLFVFRYILLNRKLTDLMYRFAYYAQFILPGRQGVARHLPLLWSGRRSIPQLSPQSVIKKYGSDLSAKTGEKAVYFFPGCLMNYAQADAGKSIIRVLKHFGYRVIVPLKQVCCGTPVLSIGDIKAARTLAERNIYAMQTDIPVVTGCASCGETLKHNYEYLLGEKARNFSSRVFDFAEFMDRFVEFDPQMIQKKVIYHDPCHLKFGQGIDRSPRRLLKKTSDYREVPGADYCCGMAGLFSVHHYPLSRKLTKRKISAMKGFPADLLVTECPGCIAQLRDRFIDEGIDIPVRHFATVLEEALVDGRGIKKNLSSAPELKQVPVPAVSEKD